MESKKHTLTVYQLNPPDEEHRYYLKIGGSAVHKDANAISVVGVYEAGIEEVSKIEAVVLRCVGKSVQEVRQLIQKALSAEKI